MRKSRRKYKDGIYTDSQGRLIERQGRAVCLYWSKPMTDYLKANFATTYNDELSDHLGVSKRMVNRKAKELGLKKAKEWLTSVYRKNIQFAILKNRVYGNSGMFRKGYNGGKQFKAGYKRTDEQEAKRMEGVRKMNANPIRRKQRAMKAWQTRRMNQQSQMQKEATI